MPPQPQILIRRARIGLALLLISTAVGGYSKTPADWVNPMIGTDREGKTFPGADTPFGLVQVSPQTITGGDNGSGYRDYHKTIQGFSFTQMSGIGWYGDLGNFLVMPTTGPLKTYYGETDKPGTGYLASYDKSSERAQAGYYSVTLKDPKIEAEMTAAAHSGIMRFTFPENAQSRLQIDLARRVGGTSVEQSVKVVDDHSIEGWMRCTPEGGGWGNGGGKPNFTVYFHAEFSIPLKKFGVWSAEIPDGWKRRLFDIAKPEYVAAVREAKLLPGCKEMTGKHLGFYSEFPTQANQTILLKTGISFVSIEGARAGLKAEIPNWNFSTVQTRARQIWEKQLDKIRVEGGTEEQRIAFYSALYHATLDPRTFSDLNGDYPGGDGAVHRAEKFTRRTIFSGWDVFRSQMPLLTIMAPDVVNDLVNSMIELAGQNRTHWFDRWEFLNAYSGCMIANPMVAVISDAYAKGIRGFDTNLAYEFSRNSCERDGNGPLGYSPEGISCTLERGYNEWCLSQLAKQLGHPEDALKYAERSQSYRKIFDPDLKWFRAKDKEGNWNPWTEKSMTKIADQGCVESNPGQQGWFVPHDVPGFAELLGGNEVLVARLNEFFEKTPRFRGWNDFYNHANEVVHLAPFLFNRAGAPWLTQKWVRKICELGYGAGADGLAGDEDVGQMSAWYVLCASGLHPACPGEPRYEIFSPLFDQITFHLDPKYSQAGTFKIVAKGNSKKNFYIQSATLNGKPLNRCWITHQEILAGGELVLVLGPEPNKNWGKAQS